MDFLIIGINHQTASVAIREQLVFSSDILKTALKHLKSHTGAQECLILTTCNRTEIYLTGRVTPNQVRKWLIAYHNLKAQPLSHCFYSYTQTEAITHAMRVAAGLDSLILGEPQILGQIKSAYAISRSANCLFGPLDLLFQYAFNVAKKIRTKTAIGQNTVSIAYAAIQLAHVKCQTLKNKTFLLIGAGNTIELVYRHLQSYQMKHIIVANRTQEKALSLTQGAKNTTAILLRDMPWYLNKADIIMTSTASQLPILGKGMIEKTMEQRDHKPIILIDLAVPRDVEPEIATMPNVTLYTLDDLSTLVLDNLNIRKQAAKLAEVIIEENTHEFISKLREQAINNTVAAYRKQAMQLKESVLKKSYQLLKSGKPVDEILEQLAHNLTNKLIHQPCIALRKASSEGDLKRIAWAKELVDNNTDELTQKHEQIYH
ncbi:MAG: glutamyl-tRNA reductase [Endozoicomonadaceae bacterium]|nr:glutamyl-tRNA reductase [Endozoicomonadaceae bacterium]